MGADPRRRGRLDPARTLLPLAGGLVPRPVFVARERAGRPMLPLRLFWRARSPPATSSSSPNAASSGAVFFTAQCFQMWYHHGAFVAGLWLLPLGVAPLLVGPRAGALADRFGERSLIRGA